MAVNTKQKVKEEIKFAKNKNQSNSFPPFQNSKKNTVGSSQSESALKMRQEAEAKLLEMHSRSKQYINSENTKKTNKKNTSKQKTVKKKVDNKKTFTDSGSKSKGFLGIPNFLETLFKDSDKSLILSLIILLMDDEDNMMLLFALFYLLM